jgi:hypothetical protein
MPKRKEKDIVSKIIEEKCIKPNRKAKEEAVKNEDLVKANYHSGIENFCKIQIKSHEKRKKKLQNKV